jgi:hypothetical protein
MIKIIKKYFSVFLAKFQRSSGGLELSNESAELIAKIKFPCC